MNVLYVRCAHAWMHVCVRFSKEENGKRDGLSVLSSDRIRGLLPFSMYTYDLSSLQSFHLSLQKMTQLIDAIRLGDKDQVANCLRKGASKDSVDKVLLVHWSVKQFDTVKH